MAKKQWTLDSAHSEISFKVKHLMITNVRGGFKSFDVEYDGKESGKVKIYADTINTGDEKRDEHLKSPDFLEVNVFPFIEFEITELKGRKLVGNLTVKNETHPVELKVKKGKVVDAYGNKKLGFSVEGVIKRSTFGLTWNIALEAGGFVVSDDVTVNAEVQMIKA